MDCVISVVRPVWPLLQRVLVHFHVLPSDGDYERAVLELWLRRVWPMLKELPNELRSYESRVRGLDKGVNDLQRKRNKVQHELEEEGNRYWSEIEDVLVEWLDEVDDVIAEHENFNKDEDRQYAGCSNGFLPNPVIRNRLNKTAKDITRKVNELLTKYSNFSNKLGPPSIESFRSRDKTRKKIMAALDDPSVRMIGVYGLTGVGKTTLVKEIAKTALIDTIFHVVVMANVTRSPDVKKIQGHIADGLGLKLEEESVVERAARIRHRLKNQKENSLIILDDIWEKLDFNMLGIPSENNNDSPDNLEEKSPGAHTPYRRCKVLMISETKKLLLSHMYGKRNTVFHVEVLKEKEALTLFKKMAETGDENPEFETLAAQIAKKCKGLPKAIVATAVALKNQSLTLWEDVHRRLERQNSTGVLHESYTKLSYDLLENEELKYTFLLCALLGHDALIVDLVRYCIGLGFLQGIFTVKDAGERVYALVGKLKRSSLLSDSYSSDRFTMQETVRSAALSIASQEMPVFAMTKGNLDEWPNEDKLERYTTISLQHCDIFYGFPESLNCPRLRVFHVDNNSPYLKIPDNFFEGMRELRVLILTSIHLSPLPSSIRCLTKLRMLCLERCVLGEGLSIIGELKKLRILSLSGSDIERLPIELKQLAKLQILDISNCYKLREIPPNVISSLSNLEELYMRNNLIQWNVEGQTNQSENASLSELRHLNQLTTLDLQIPYVAYLPKNLFLDKLCSYKIVIGDLNANLESDHVKMPEKYEAPRFLAIQLKDGFDIHSQMGIKMMFEKVENLLLGDLNDVQDIFYELNLKGFPYLKHLSIVSNSDIKSLINPKDRRHPEKAFPQLESLYLYNLKNMMQICSCNLSAPSFGKLNVVKIKRCGRLCNVFLISVIRHLIALETIEVSECNSLKEIVSLETQSNTDEIEPLKFPVLHSLSLQSLAKFIGFYPISSTGETKELFHEKVKVSKLKRIKLSSIPIDKIWSDQPSLSSYFQNLIHLDVNGCWNLKYLLSFSMAKRLVNLQSLFISKCENMRLIFSQGQVSDDKMKGGIFPNLKNIKFSSMKCLSEIWNYEVPVDSFGKLDTLIIEECDKLVDVFSRYMVGIFRSLCNLRVTNCKSMKAIFDLYGQKRNAGCVTNLQDVHLEALPKLEHIWKWNKDQERILNFKNLQKIWVHECRMLENIFPVSVAKYLVNLEYLLVWDCSELREIVAEGEVADANTSSLIPFEFLKLTTIKLLKLQKLKSFYPGAHELSCPAVNELAIELCGKLEPFKIETADAQRKPVFFAEEVMNKLKSMQIDSRHAKSSSSYMGNYRRDNLEELHLSKLMNTDILHRFLHSNPNLKSLSLNNCFFEELVTFEWHPEIQNFGAVIKLRSLKLIDLPNLVSIGFERDMVLQRIECLMLKECPRLITTMPSSVSLTHLTNLEVVNCNGLINLMPPSTAKSLVLLSTMKVINCESLEEIVSEQGNEEEIACPIDIVFRQLKTLELVYLKNLKSFCGSNTFVFEFPSLEKLVVSACPKMENFCESFRFTPTLQKIYVIHEKEKKRWYWNGDLNATIRSVFKEKLFFEGMDELRVSDHLELQEAWRGEVGLQNNWFYSLETLKLENCEIQPYAIPSNVLPYLKSLKELKVRDCNNVKIIFEMNDTDIMGTAFQLKKLTLEELRNLTHVWEKNREGVVSFQNLQEVIVNDCDLRTLFPAALAKNLKKLEKLEIKFCHKLLEIVGKEEAAAAAESTEYFVFPHLTSLDLLGLPELTYFYPESFTLECPALNNLSVLRCDTLVLFHSQQVAYPEGQDGSTSINRQPLFWDLEAISNLEQLSLNWKDTLVLGSRFGQLFTEEEDLRCLNQLNLYFDDDVNEESTLPFEILEKAPNLETIAVSCCSDLKERFPSQIVANRMLGRLKALLLYDISELQSIGSEDSSWLNTICVRLHKLHVQSCPRLTTLLHSDFAGSFSYLKSLDIKKCHGLKYLFTSSTAKQLIHLEEMCVKECESMKEVVAKEQDEITPEEIKFKWLEKIDLENLSSLQCFYSGDATLQLPSLIQLDIWNCPNMKTFSKGVILAASFRGIQVAFDSNDDLVFHDDLNTTVERVFLQQDHLILGDYPIVQKIWLELDPVPDRCFSNLISLVMEGCEFLSNAILPSHLLPFLSNLEELQVRKCHLVEAIFDTKMIYMGRAPDSPSIRLKKLILEQLPILKHVWNEDPQGSLSLPFLEEVLVDGCENIKSLFPASVAKDILLLKRLVVKNCEGLVEIVAEDEAATLEAIKELVSNVTSLRLWNLPNLKCIYPGMHILEWPMLTELDVLHCHMLKIFATEFENSPDSNPEGQDRFPIGHQALVSLEKVGPHFKDLSLNKEYIMMIEQGQLHVNLQELKFLKLQCFYDESDVFPYIFLSKLPLPSIKKLGASHSAFKEIFPSQEPDADCTKILSQLKGLELNNLYMLKSIGLEHSWIGPFLENLETLVVMACNCLSKLVRSTVSFFHMTELNVEDCAGLKYLFTSSTAKSLGALEKMSITNCVSLNKIVAEEGDEPDEDVMIFGQLKILSLSLLPKLGSFYPGSSTLNFPSLEEVSFTQCHNMKIFCHGDVLVPKNMQGKIDGVRWYGDLNTAVERQFGEGSSLG